MRVLKSFWIAVLTCAVLSSTSFAGATPQNGHTPSDEHIKVSVERKLSDLELASSPVNVSVQDGVVTLSGTVPSLWLKQEAINRARKMDDVKTVVADLRVDRVSPERPDGHVVALREFPELRDVHRVARSLGRVDRTADLPLGHLTWTRGRRGVAARRPPRRSPSPRGAASLHSSASY